MSHLKASKRSAYVRSTRARLLRQLRACEIDLAPLFDHEAIVSMRVEDLVRWIPHTATIRTGKAPQHSARVRVDRFLRDAQIHPRKRIDELSDRQRIAILNYQIERLTV